MTNNNPTVTIVCIAVLFVCCIYSIYKIFWAPQTEEVTEVITNEDDPYLKQIRSFRQTLVENIVSTLGMVWFVSPADIHFKVELTDWNNNLITIVYQNHLIRCYIDWKAKRMKVVYSFRNDCYKFAKSKNFRLKNNAINLEAFSSWITNIYKTILLNAWPTVDDQAADCIMQGKQMAEDENLTLDDFNDMVFEVWQNYVIHSNKKEIESDLISFAKLTAFVMRNCPEQLKKFVEQHKKINSK